MSMALRQIGGSLRLSFRELWATFITLGLFVVATLGWLFLSLAMNIDVVEGSVAALKIFGLESTPTQAVQDEAGNWLQEAMNLERFVIGVQGFVFGSAYFLGTLLGIFATAPLAASMLTEPRVGLLLSKPTGRGRLLLGHVLAVFITVLILTTYLIGSTWLVLSYKTGIWEPRFLVGIPATAGMFAVMYGVVLLLVVVSRSSGAALIGAYGLIFISFILAGREGILKTLGDTGQVLFDVLYHVLPNFLEVLPLTVQLIEGGSVESWIPVTTSVIFGILTYLSAALWFVRKDF